MILFARRRGHLGRIGARRRRAWSNEAPPDRARLRVERGVLRSVWILAPADLADKGRALARDRRRNGNWNRLWRCDCHNRSLCGSYRVLKAAATERRVLGVREDARRVSGARANWRAELCAARARRSCKSSGGEQKTAGKVA